MIIVPKRKLETGMPGDDNIKAILAQVPPSVNVPSSIGRFKWELQIPVGTDMYPGGHG